MMYHPKNPRGPKSGNDPQKCDREYCSKVEGGFGL